MKEFSFHQNHPAFTFHLIIHIYSFLLPHVFGPLLADLPQNSLYFLYLSAASVISCDIAEKIRLQIKTLKWNRVTKGRHTFQTPKMFAVSSPRPRSAVTTSTCQVIMLISRNCGLMPLPTQTQRNLNVKCEKKRRKKNNSHGLQKQRHFCLVEQTSK